MVANNSPSDTTVVGLPARRVRFPVRWKASPPLDCWHVYGACSAATSPYSHSWGQEPSAVDRRACSSSSSQGREAAEQLIPVSRMVPAIEQVGTTSLPRLSLRDAHHNCRI